MLYQSCDAQQRSLKSYLLRFDGELMASRLSASCGGPSARRRKSIQAAADRDGRHVGLIFSPRNIAIYRVEAAI